MYGSSLANAGTPLMWAGMLHLAFGNALVGLVEAAVIARVLRRVWATVVLASIAVNYASAWAGYLLLPQLAARWGPQLLGDRPIFHLGRFYWTMVAAAVTLTVAIELPILLALFWKKADRTRLIGAALAAQVVSYTLLLGYYHVASRNTLGGFESLESPAGLAQAGDAHVLFISPEDGDVYATRLDGSPPERFAPMGERSRDAILVAREDDAGTKRLLVVDPTNSRLVTNLPSAVRIPEDDGSPAYSWRREAASLAAPSADAWQFVTHSWPFQGLLAYHPDGERIAHVAVELPMLAWHARAATALDEHQAVFALGDQVLLVDAERMKLAFVTRGRGPVVVRGPVTSSATRMMAPTTTTTTRASRAVPASQ